MTYERNLIDDIGEIRPRKNQYIIDSIKAEENGGNKVDAKNHPYNQKLKKYEEEKKELLAKADEAAKKDPNYKLDQKYLRDLYYRKFMANYCLDFYEENKGLSYDSELDYKLCKLEYEQIPKIIEHDLLLKSQLERASNRLEKLTSEEVESAKKLIEEDRIVLKEKFESDNKNLEDSFSKGRISKKAFKSEKEQLKQKFKDQNKRLDYRNPEVSLKEEI